jgi:hypothetical protein
LQKKLRRGPRPCNRFRYVHIEKLKKELKHHLIASFCLGASLTLSGPNWERIGSVMMAAVYRHGAMEKFDMYKGDVAWSAKTSEQLSAGAVYFKLLNLSREDLAREGSLAAMEPNDLGRRALFRYNADVVGKTYERFEHFRSLILYRTHDLDKYTLYEKDIQPVRPSLYRWKKHYRKGKYVSAHALEKATGQHRFSLTLGDCRLFLADTIPADAHVFSVRLDTGEMEQVKHRFRAICDQSPDCVSIGRILRKG